MEHQSLPSLHSVAGATSSTPQFAQHASGFAHDVVDAEPNAMLDCKGIFPRGTHVTSMGKLKVSFLVDDNLIPMKTNNLTGIYEVFSILCIILLKFTYNYQLFQTNDNIIF